PDAFPIENDQIDLATMVRESVLLDLPDSPVCRPDCAGLCPACGADRNLGDCGCRIETPDPRWAGLDAIRDQLPE
ncbi:MAG: YceD family protein, partial [Ilumatobacteraceae bacterium]